MACKIHCKRITPNDSQTDIQNTNASHSIIRLKGGGIGLLNVQSSIKKYDGNLTLKYIGNKFIAELFLNS